MRPDEFIRKRGNEFPFCITMVDLSLPDQPLIYLNEALLRLTGYMSHELLGKNCRVLQNGQGNPESRRVIREAIKDGRPLCRDLLNFKKSGEPFYNRIVFLPFVGRYYLGLQHPISKEMYEKINKSTSSEIFDETLNPISVLLLNDMFPETVYKTNFEEATQRIRNFILQVPKHSPSQSTFSPDHPQEG